MKKLSQYILIKEQLEDNLYWKLDQWFHNNEEQKQQFIDIVSQCRVSKPDKSTIDFMLNNIKFDTKKFVDFVMDNTDNKELDDYPYIMQKTIDTIIANKSNKYNTEEN